MKGCFQTLKSHVIASKSCEVTGVGVTFDFNPCDPGVISTMAVFGNIQSGGRKFDISSLYC